MIAPEPTKPIHHVARYLHSTFCQYRHTVDACSWDHETRWDIGAHAQWVLLAHSVIHSYEEAVRLNNARV